MIIKSKKHFEKLLHNADLIIQNWDENGDFPNDVDKSSLVLGYQIARIYIELNEIFLSISCNFDLGNYPYSLFSSSNVDYPSGYKKGFETLENFGE